MKKLIFTSTFLLLAACGKSFQATELDKELQKPVVANQEAKSYSDWHNSKDNPDAVFSTLIKKFLNKELTDTEICEGFEKMPSLQLSLFENNIRQKEHSFIMKPCREALIKKLDDYWNEERAKLKIPQKPSTEKKTENDGAIVHRFAQIVEVERDVSKGYMAVSGDLEPGQVALTFDDGPHETFTQEILEALEAANAKATFFVMGNNVKRYPEQLKAVAHAGHSIGTHSQTHRCLGNKAVCGKNNKSQDSDAPVILSFEEAAKDIFSAHQAVKDLLGWVSPFFRFPFGETSPELKVLLKSSGTGEFYWSVDSNDWRTLKKDGTAYTAAEMVDDIMKEIKAKKRGLLLNHDVQKKTAVALPAILNRLFEEGYQPVVFVPKDRNANLESDLLKQATLMKEAASVQAVVQ